MFPVTDARAMGIGGCPVVLSTEGSEFTGSPRGEPSGGDWPENTVPFEAGAPPGSQAPCCPHVPNVPRTLLLIFASHILENADKRINESVVFKEQQLFFFVLN